MATSTVSAFGQSLDITVPATQKIAIANRGGGTAFVEYKTDPSNEPSAYYPVSTLSPAGYLAPGTEVVLGTFANDRTVRITAGYSPVEYSVGASPTISQNMSDVLTGIGTQLAVSAPAGTAGTGTTAGTAGGAASLTAGAGGAKTDTGHAAGGAGASSTVAGGAGGATASNGTDAGGAGGNAAVTGGAGGAASAGTGNGGVGGDVSVTPGAGGATTGGTAGRDGVVRVAGTMVRKLTRSTIGNGAAVTAAQVRTGVLYQDASGGAVTMTTPTASALDTEFPTLATGEALDLFCASNHATNTSTISGGSNVTLVGSGAITQLGGSFKLIRTGTATYDLVRVS